MPTHSLWKHFPGLVIAAGLWFVACSSDNGTTSTTGGGGSSGNSVSSSGGPAHAGTSGALTGSAGGAVVVAGASGSLAGAPGTAGAGGASGAGGALSSVSGGSSVAGTVSSTAGASDPCASVTCGSGQTCSNGTCMCTTGMLCSGACVDTQNDQNHCGSCTTACAADGSCVNGACVNPMCNPDTTVRMGHITHYSLATSMVACHYPTSTLPQNYGAMNEYDWNAAAVCGACVEITNLSNQQKLTLEITDECPYKGNEQWCFQGSHHIDLSVPAASALGASNNNPAISWKYVPCATTGNIKYYFDTACQQYYLAVTPMNARNVVAKMEVQVKGVWTALNHTAYNTYELTSGAGTGALMFRVTDIYNHVVTDTVTMTAGQTVDGSKQFAACP